MVDCLSASDLTAALSFVGYGPKTKPGTKPCDLVTSHLLLAKLFTGGSHLISSVRRPKTSALSGQPASDIILILPFEKENYAFY